MQNLYYIVAIILLISWGLGFFIFNAGYLIHILLIFGVIAILLKIIKTNDI